MTSIILVHAGGMAYLWPFLLLVDMKTNDTVRVAIIGLGVMGSGHARAYQQGQIQNGKLVAVCDSSEKQLASFPEAKPFTSADDLFRWGEFDAVVVATPHYGHTTLGIQALQNGKHLLVEKPVSVHKADCEKLYAAYTDKNLVFGAVFNKRPVQLYSKLKAFIDSGELGQLRRINWIITDWFRTYAYYRSGTWRATWAGEGGGVLLNQCPHELDLWQWLFGMPKKLRAYCQFGRYHDIEVEDDVTAYMEYANGMTGVFIASTGESPGTNRLEIVGERGRVIVEPGKDIHFLRNTVEMSEFSRTAKGGFDRTESWDIRIPASSNVLMHTAMQQNFVDAILHGTPLIASALDGIHSVELANAMIYSSVRNEDVHFPLDSGKYAKLLEELIAGSKKKS